MKKLTIGFCAAMILLTGAVITACRNEEEGFGGSTSTEVADRIASLESQVASLQQSISSLKAASEASESTLREELEAQKTALETAKAELQKEIDAITGTTDFGNMVDRLEALESKVPGNYSDLSEKITSLAETLDGKSDTVQVHVMLDELKAGFDGAIAAAETQITACETAVAKLDSTCAAMQKQLTNMQAALGGKVDTAAYNAFIRETNGKIQANAQALSVLQALCAGFEEGETVKGYIDEAVGAVTTQLGSYVLQETYETFVAEYGTFKTEIDAKVAENEMEIAALKNTIADLSPDVNIGDLIGVEERIVLLNNRIDSLKDNSLTLEKVETEFNKSNTAFLNGVNSIITDAIDAALDADGAITVAISDALAQKAEELQADYQKKIDELSKRVGVLESKVDVLEGKVDALLKRIQSLVYVPQTTDGRIHIGPLYVANGKDSINITTTKKIEYRVSPAGLRDSLLILYKARPEAFLFWQEHVSRVETRSIGLHTLDANTVTRAGESKDARAGLHEFNILKIEPGNSDGTLMLTVNNEHNFTHEDLAVSLCIRYEDAKTGVSIEYSSAYTPVAGDGLNLNHLFYLAKKDENGNYTKVSRTDRIDYTLIYDDQTPVEIMKGYEVVYDNGEDIMTLADAKKKYNWEVDLKGRVSRTGNAESNGTLEEGKYELTNKESTNQPLQFALKEECTEEQVGKSWHTNTYTAEVVTGTYPDQTKVAIIPNVDVYVTVVPPAYKVSAEVTWNSSNFYYGKTYDWKAASSIYTTPGAKLTYSKDSKDTPAGNLPISVYQNLFADGHSWNLTDPCDSLHTNNLTVTSKVVGDSLAFNVQGFVWCEDTHHITMSRTGNNKIPTSGKDSILVTGTLDFVGPTKKDLTVTIGSETPIAMSSNANSTSYKGQGNSSSFALLYMTVNTSLVPDDKIFPLSTKFFSSDMILSAHDTKVNVDEVECTKQDGGGAGSPQKLKLEYYTRQGGRPIPVLRSINVKDTETDGKISSITQETTYKTGEFTIEVMDGPTITVNSVTFKVAPDPAK